MYRLLHFFELPSSIGGPMLTLMAAWFNFSSTFFFGDADAGIERSLSTSPGCLKMANVPSWLKASDFLCEFVKGCYSSKALRC